MRTRISVNGFTEAEAEAALADVTAELAERPWRQPADVAWDRERRRLVVTVEAEGTDPSPDGPDARGALDEVWDVVLACVQAAGRVSFHVDSHESVGTA